MKKINMGCGWRNFGSDWIHIDGGNYNHLDHHSITSLPFEEESIDLIYASHVIEYFDREEVKAVLAEWNRVLKKGGILRVAVPDFSVMSWLYEKGEVQLKHILGPLYGKMNMGDETIYHKTVYDYISLADILMECGFCEICEYEWRETDHAEHDDHSQAYFPHMDKDNGVLISLNVECRK